MSTLTEIEAAVDSLPAAEQQKLFFFLAGKLRKHRAERPEPRDISLEQIRAWIAKDEAAMRDPRGKVILFLDTSVILAACASPTGGSGEIISKAIANQWVLISCDFAADEVLRNLPKFGPEAAREWESVKPLIAFLEDVLVLDGPVVFEPSKDRPILFTAAVWADILVTLDEEHSGVFYAQPFYGLQVCEPGDFLKRFRAGLSK